MGRHGQTIGADPDLRRAVHNPTHAFHDIVHVCKVALTIAHVENLNRIATTQLLGEAKVRHVGTAHRSVHRKEAKSGSRNGIELRVSCGHELIALLGGSI